MLFVLTCRNQYIVDQPQRGRSPWELTEGSAVYFTVEQLESEFTAPQDYDLYPLSVFHTQWPGVRLQCTSGTG